MADGEDIMEALNELITKTLETVAAAVPPPLQIGLVLVHPDMPDVSMFAGNATPELTKVGLERVIADLGKKGTTA